MENRSLDDIIKSSLENFEPEQYAHDWAFMESLLDKRENTSTDEVNDTDEIDKIAKAALQEYTVPFVATDWAMMDAQLDDAGFPHEVDQAARKALQDFETAPADWKLMEASLSEIEQVRRHLIITKSIEVVLFIFAIWTIGNFLTFNTKSSNQKDFPIVKVEQERSILESKDDNNADVDNHSTPNDISGNNSAINTIQDEVRNTQNNFFFQKNAAFRKSKTYPTMPKIFGEPIIGNSNSTINTEVVTPNITDTTSTEPIAMKSKENSFDSKSYGKRTGRKQVLASFIEQKASKIFFKNAENPTLHLYASRTGGPFHLKASVSTQHAQILENDRNHFAVGLAKGIGVDYAISDKIELSTGFVYNTMGYTYKELEPFVNASSPKIVEISRNVQLDILQIPFRINFNFKKDKKTRLYAIAGVTPGLIIKEDTKDADASLISDVTPATYRTILEEHRNTYAFSSTEIGNTNSSSISARAFATIDLGIGLEYKSHKRLSFFIEPLFQRSIKNIGNQEESYKNYALVVGSRVAL